MTRSNCNASWSAAQTASFTNFAALATTPGLNLGAMFHLNTTITEAAVGNYVLQHYQYQLEPSGIPHAERSGGAYSTFVLNISGDVTINGDANGSGILLIAGMASRPMMSFITLRMAAI